MPISSPSSSRAATTKATKPVLIVHIGDHKTGSTSIQNAFSAGRVSLAGKKVLYPGLLDHNYLSEHAKLLARGKPAPEGRDGMPGFDLIAAELADTPDADFCLLSGEAFEGIRPEALKIAIDQFLAPHISDVRLVCYIRPHAGRTLSTYSEQTKIGWFQGTPEGMHRRTLKTGRFFFARRLRRWQAVFGDKLIVRPMIRSELLNGDVVQDFVATAFGGLPFDIAAGASGNESLGLEDLMLLKHLHAHMDKVNKGARLGLGWELAQRAGHLPRPKGTTKLQLHRALARDIHDSYLEDARALDTEFFGNRGLFVGDLERSVANALDKAQPCNPKAHFNARELRDMTLVAETLAAMLDREQMNWAYWFRNRRAELLHPLPAASPGRRQG